MISRKKVKHLRNFSAPPSCQIYAIFSKFFFNSDLFLPLIRNIYLKIKRIMEKIEKESQ